LSKNTGRLYRKNLLPVLFGRREPPQPGERLPADAWSYMNTPRMKCHMITGSITEFAIRSGLVWAIDLAAGIQVCPNHLGYQRLRPDDAGAHDVASGGYEWL
jgi:hypothetical protein